MCALLSHPHTFKVVFAHVSALCSNLEAFANVTKCHNTSHREIFIALFQKCARVGHGLKLFEGCTKNVDLTNVTTLLHILFEFGFFPLGGTYLGERMGRDLARCRLFSGLLVVSAYQG